MTKLITEQASARRNVLLGEVLHLQGRNRPVDISEIRYELDYDGVFVCSAPLDAYEAFAPCSIKPVESLWEPVVAELRSIWLNARPFLELRMDSAAKAGALHANNLIGPHMPHVAIPRPDSLTRLRDCQTCNAKFFASNNRSHFSYCCSACDTGRTERQAKANQKRAAWLLANRRDKSCSNCGEIFTPLRSSGQFCSSSCRVSAHRAKQQA